MHDEYRMHVHGNKNGPCLHRSIRPNLVLIQPCLVSTCTCTEICIHVVNCRSSLSRQISPSSVSLSVRYL